MDLGTKRPRLLLGFLPHYSLHTSFYVRVSYFHLSDAIANSIRTMNNLLKNDDAITGYPHAEEFNWIPTSLYMKLTQKGLLILP